ncbi:hypothetical protein [Azoarcus indigens]|uniref:Uncharacterized protein n=1 Tax=Azoarcus indigens TaxID=29545 RepID=A0A4V3BM39_9RHOO|nr:hypothetical protein [Azoarcus indigens]TDN49192.1 hypothetical protein C7389_11243 [Azoarcus indigens]
MTSLRDAVLEARIWAAKWAMLACDRLRRIAANEFVRLIRRRSPERVQAMEKQRGLR